MHKFVSVTAMDHIFVIRIIIITVRDIPVHHSVREQQLFVSRNQEDCIFLLLNAFIFFDRFSQSERTNTLTI